LTFGRFYGKIELSQPGKERFSMGMTDSQFKAFIRFVLDSLQEVKKEKDPAAREERLNKVIDNLQKALED
jgi:hypothetical protein